MRSNNPVFANSEAFSRGGYATFDPTPGQLQDMYDRPAATPVQTRRMTLDDVIMKSGALFAVLLVTGAISWYLVGDSSAFGIPFIAMLVGLVLGLVISIKQSTNPALILTYAAVEGVFVGGISRVFANVYEPEIVSQAVFGTLVAFGTMLVLYRTRIIRVTEKFMSFMKVALISYLVIALVSFVAALFGTGGGWGFYGVGPLGILLCLLGVGLASFSLLLDFDFIENGVKQGLPERFSWLAAFGLLVTLVWLYIELLRLLAILRGEE